MSIITNIQDYIGKQVEIFNGWDKSMYVGTLTYVHRAGYVHLIRCFEIAPRDSNMRKIIKKRYDSIWIPRSQIFHISKTAMLVTEFKFQGQGANVNPSTEHGRGTKRRAEDE